MPCSSAPLGDGKTRAGPSTPVRVARMRALVTGASGFVGGIVCRRLLERGDEVHALVRRAGPAPAGTTPAPADLSDADALHAAVAAAAPDVVVHLAAEIASQ